MSGPRYDRILASTALALILAAPLGAAAVAQEAAETRYAEHAESAAQRAAAKFAAAALDAAITPQPKNEIPPVAGPGTGRSIERGVSPAPAPAPWFPNFSGAKERLPPRRPRPASAPAAAKDAAAPATPANPDHRNRANGGAGSHGLARSGRPGCRREDSRPARRQERQDFRQQEGAQLPSRRSIRRVALLRCGSRRAWRTARSKAVIARLKGAEADGLEVNDYKTPNFAGMSPDALADAELKLTQTVLTYARHVQAGRFPYTRVSNNIELLQAPPEAAEVLAKVADAADAGKALDGLQPAARGLQEAQGHARGDARQDRRHWQRDCRRPVAQGQRQGPDDGRPARSAAAREARARRRGVRPQVRRQARRGGQEVPARQRAARHRQSRREDHQGAQRPAAREARSTSSSPTWNAGAGIRATSARPMWSSINRTSRSR